ncbi:MAG: hypothetical protein IJT83_08115, partial [Victivallales bacterium]|nr:hypothetical protein [Victivallales bacterium]
MLKGLVPSFDTKKEASNANDVMADARNTAFINGCAAWCQQNIEDAWDAFVKEGNENGRNNSMLPLFLRWLRNGLDVEDAVELACERYYEEWPEGDLDAHEQLEHAACKAEEIIDDDNATPRPHKGAQGTICRKTQMERQQKAAIEELKNEFCLSDILKEAAQIPETARFDYIDPNDEYADESMETLARFMADVTRTIHGLNAYIFCGKREQSGYQEPCWYYTGQPAKVPEDDKLIQ